MRSVFAIIRKRSRRLRRRLLVGWRSLLLHFLGCVLVCALVALGLLARMLESTDLQVAIARRSPVARQLVMRQLAEPRLAEPGAPCHGSSELTAEPTAGVMAGPLPGGGDTSGEREHPPR